MMLLDVWWGNLDWIMIFRMQDWMGKLQEEWYMAVSKSFKGHVNHS
jgi:hypothetical protein